MGINVNFLRTFGHHIAFPWISRKLTSISPTKINIQVAKQIVIGPTTAATIWNGNSESAETKHTTSELIDELVHIFIKWKSMVWKPWSINGSGLLPSLFMFTWPLTVSLLNSKCSQPLTKILLIKAKIVKRKSFIFNFIPPHLWLHKPAADGYMYFVTTWLILFWPLCDLSLTWLNDCDGCNSIQRILFE